ncbi:HET-domain-containing protein [Alternaria alternata]|uniref:HET-domain-containing protein n=1 Tax=Alternaria alternata TaxID=5599 RepID=A0A177DMA6_ALTAL|nr:HET-domain-containing protein [Alternaria alternata]OAG20498.1 HET-domain-containing protein [Alternaria alternata]
MSTSTYPIYKTLPDASDNLRLLIVHAGGMSEPIRCTLRIVSLHNKPSYDALSYTWGDSATTKPIEVDGFKIRVTTNLEQALRHLRDVKNDLTLWVDAVCINQSDNSEKSQQVALMGQIYRQCAQVRIWLGCDSFRCGIAQSSLHASNAVDDSSGAVDPFEILRHLADDRHIHEWSCFHTQNDDGRDRVVYKADEKFDTIIEAFIAVTESPWWSRMWTVQEAILPKEGLLTHDTWSISLQIIADCGMNYHHHWTGCCQEAASQLPPKIRDPMVEFFGNLATLSNDRRVLVNGNVANNDLRRQHVAYGFRACKDPRDKVYGLLGIVHDTSFTPDYTHSIDEVFLHATLHMLCHERDTLSSLTGRSYGPAHGKWASWVREFDAPFDRMDASVAMNRNSFLDFNNFDASDGRRRVGSIIFVSQDKQDSVLDGVRKAVFKRWMIDAVDWAGSDNLADMYIKKDTSGNVSSCTDKFLQFWRTLLGGMDATEGTEANFSMWTNFTPATIGWLDSFLPWLQDANSMNQSLHQIITTATHGRCYFKADNSGQGLCYPNACVGDEVWVLDGGKVPFILRPTRLEQEERLALEPLDEGAFRDNGTLEFLEFRPQRPMPSKRFSRIREIASTTRKIGQSLKTPQACYQFMGDCYFDGFMHGEAIHNTVFKEKTIVLV